MKKQLFASTTLALNADVTPSATDIPAGRREDRAATLCTAPWHPILSGAFRGAWRGGAGSQPDKRASEVAGSA